mgnify:CR=1 FL=1
MSDTGSLVLPWPYDMKVLAFDPYIDDEVFERHHVQKVDWETLLGTSDIISVHVPLKMIDVAELEIMKFRVILLNTAQGGIINESVLWKCFKSGKVASTGIDTWAVEPPLKSDFWSILVGHDSSHLGLHY